jgi:IS4 transposase
MDTRRINSTFTDSAMGAMCNQHIAINGFYVAKHYPEHLWRIRFKVPGSGKTFEFLTNNMLLPPLTFAALYNSRWQIELFFKWIKPHLRITKFLGTSEYAVEEQI